MRVAKGGGRGVKGGGGRGGTGEAAWGQKAVLGKGMFRCFPVGAAGKWTRTKLSVQDSRGN